MLVFILYQLLHLYAGRYPASLTNLLCLCKTVVKEKNSESWGIPDQLEKNG